jgi:hypothetical protein
LLAAIINKHHIRVEDRRHALLDEYQAAGETDARSIARALSNRWRHASATPTGEGNSYRSSPNDALRFSGGDPRPDSRSLSVLARRRLLNATEGLEMTQPKCDEVPVAGNPVFKGTAIPTPENSQAAAGSELDHDLEGVLADLRRVYNSGRTRSLCWREEQLDGIVKLVTEHEQTLAEALARIWAATPQTHGSAIWPAP